MVRALFEVEIGRVNLLEVAVRSKQRHGLKEVALQELGHSEAEDGRYGT